MHVHSGWCGRTLPTCRGSRQLQPSLWEPLCWAGLCPGHQAVRPAMAVSALDTHTLLFLPLSLNNTAGQRSPQLRVCGCCKSSAGGSGLRGHRVVLGDCPSTGFRSCSACSVTAWRGVGRGPAPWRGAGSVHRASVTHQADSQVLPRRGSQPRRGRRHAPGAQRLQAISVVTLAPRSRGGQGRERGPGYPWRDASFPPKTSDVL